MKKYKSKFKNEKNKEKANVMKNAIGFQFLRLGRIKILHFNLLFCFLIFDVLFDIWLL